MKYSGAVAVVEVAGLPTAIACADAMVKSANVTLIGYEITKGGPGMVNVKICGDVGAVQAAVEAGCAVANQITQVMSKVIMPRPHADLEQILLNRNPEAHYSRHFDTDNKVSEDAIESSSPIIKDENAVGQETIVTTEPVDEEEAKAESETADEEEAVTQAELADKVGTEAEPEPVNKEEEKAKQEAATKQEPKSRHQAKTKADPAAEAEVKDELKSNQEPKSNTTPGSNKKGPKDNQGKK